MYNVNKIAALVGTLTNEGKTQAAVCAALNKKGYTTAQGKPWTRPNLGFFKTRYTNAATVGGVGNGGPVGRTTGGATTPGAPAPTLAFIGAVINDAYLTADKKVNVINAYIS